MDTSTPAEGQISHARVQRMIAQAAMLGAQALTSVNDRPEDGERQLRQLFDAHGQLLAARGPGSPVSFARFREILTGDDVMAQLLPPWVPADDMRDVQLIEGGQFRDDVEDYEYELRSVMRALLKATGDGRSTTTAFLDADHDQDKFYKEATKTGRQKDYVHIRSTVIRTPSGPDTEINSLNLPKSITDAFYGPISTAAIYNGWWFPCPICTWPMKITLRHRNRKTVEGTVRCFHPPHASMGAAYLFEDMTRDGMPPQLSPSRTTPAPVGNETVLFRDTTQAVPQPVPATNHKTLCRGVWRWTVVPGIVEVDFFDALALRGFTPRRWTPQASKTHDLELWPGLDTVDIELTAGGEEFRIDIKDYSHYTLLGRKIQADQGDQGGATWLVVPDYRAETVTFLSRVCRPYGMTAITAGDLGELICKKAGARWA